MNVGGLCLSVPDGDTRRRVRGALWTEIYQDEGAWIIPAPRTKAARERVSTGSRCAGVLWRSSRWRGRSVATVRSCFRACTESHSRTRRCRNCSGSSRSRLCRTGSGRVSGTGRPRRRIIRYRRWSYIVVTLRPIVRYRCYRSWIDSFVPYIVPYIISVITRGTYGTLAEPVTGATLGAAGVARG